MERKADESDFGMGNINTLSWGNEDEKEKLAFASKVPSKPQFDKLVPDSIEKRIDLETKKFLMIWENGLRLREVNLLLDHAQLLPQQGKQF